MVRINPFHKQPVATAHYSPTRVYVIRLAASSSSVAAIATATVTASPVLGLSGTFPVKEAWDRTGASGTSVMVIVRGTSCIAAPVSVTLTPRTATLPPP